MFYFALSMPEIGMVENGMPTIEELDMLPKMKTMVKTYAEGCFIPADIANSSLFSALTEVRFIGLGVGNTPIEAITDCLKKFYFYFSDLHPNPMLLFKLKAYGIMPKEDPFTVEDFSDMSVEDASMLCLDMYRREVIEADRIR